MTQLHEDPNLNMTLIYELPKEKRVVIGTSLQADIQVSGYAAEPYMLSILNYDHDSVFVSRMELTGDKRRVEEERKLRRMIEAQQGRKKIHWIVWGMDCKENFKEDSFPKRWN